MKNNCVAVSHKVLLFSNGAKVRPSPPAFLHVYFLRGLSGEHTEQTQQTREPEAASFLIQKMHSVPKNTGRASPYVPSVESAQAFFFTDNFFGASVNHNPNKHHSLFQSLLPLPVPTGTAGERTPEKQKKNQTP